MTTNYSITKQFFVSAFTPLETNHQCTLPPSDHNEELHESKTFPG